MQPFANNPEQYCDGGVAVKPTIAFWTGQSYDFYYYVNTPHLDTAFNFTCTAFARVTAEAAPDPCVVSVA